MTNKYVFLYTGGEQPRSEAEGKAMMDDWMAWFGKVGPSVVDGGAPLAPGGKLLGEARASGASGYSIVNADSFDGAVKLTEGHPHLARGGGIEVMECVKIPGM